MKKFIFTVNVIALIALVPAVFFGYLQNDTKKDTKTHSEIVKDAGQNAEEGITFRLIKTF